MDSDQIKLTWSATALPPERGMIPSMRRLLGDEGDEKSGLLDDWRASCLWPGRDMAVFWDLLYQATATVGCEPHFTGRVEMLNLACGRCTEALVLAAWVGNWTEDSADRLISLNGVDIRGRELAMARNRCHETLRLFSRHGCRANVAWAFHDGDATRLSDKPELPDRADVIMLRHQNAWHHMKIWAEIFDQALGRMAPDGWIIITSYFDREHAIAVNMLTGLGAELVVTVQNRHSRELPTEGKSVDRHLAIFRRGTSMELNPT